MTIYSDWLRDFPTRCTEVLAYLAPKAREQGREVTLMLTVGSMLLNVPWERLKEKDFEHPMTGHPDEAAREANRELARRFNEMLDEPFATSSTLWDNFNGSTKGKWWARNLGNEYDPAKPYYWFFPNDDRYLPSDWSVGQILGVVRNACAHAHILTYSSPEPASTDYNSEGLDPVVEDVLPVMPGRHRISRLLFVSVRSPLNEPPTKFRVVATTPEGFTELLERWAKIISTLDPLGDVKRDVEPHLLPAVS
jgi:hypothetical protein